MAPVARRAGVHPPPIHQANAVGHPRSAGLIVPAPPRIVEAALKPELTMVAGTRGRWPFFCMAWCSIALTSSPATAAGNPRSEAGGAIYEQRCSSCHGEGLNNVSGGWSFDLRKLRPDEHDRFVSSVTTGKDNMPSWYGILSDEEIELIWLYIRATVDK
jgi:mono/diheme cytochrome c family protein